ncbi:peroxisomal 2,4-dienoyl-CoA reductase-like [Durio zibethinus]|uniref:2,4-dienoyl-CoA reductase [(3E)-enoyl-CoA-producing] n=1 Tax=Durio zibethinus TaxID=66656 RepID=A0A6P5Z8Y9_DURZI|nr:peroxisomal 2,4-dienoyl-CoA reductase-like [Durio zibethinus]
MESPFNADILKGKVALGTGGGSGIGYEISLQLGKHGASIAIIGRRKHVLDSAVAALDHSHGIPVIYSFFFVAILLYSLLIAIGLEGDVRKKDDATRTVQSTFKHFGRLDILVNFLAPAEDLSPKGFRTGSSCVRDAEFLKSVL